MEQQTRFELLLPAARRRELDALAAEAGLSSAAVARLAIARLVAQPGVLLVERASGAPRLSGHGTGA
jgi:hypothetical protein